MSQKSFKFGPFANKPEYWYEHVSVCHDDPNCFRSTCGFAHPERDSKSTRWEYIYPTEWFQSSAVTEKLATPVRAEKLPSPHIEQLADFGKTDPFDWDLSATLGRELDECIPASLSMPFLDEDSTPSTPVRTSPTMGLPHALPLEGSGRLDGGFLPATGTSTPSAPTPIPVPVQQPVLTNYSPIQFQVPMSSPQAPTASPAGFQSKAKKKLSKRAKPFAVAHPEHIPVETHPPMGTATPIPVQLPMQVPMQMQVPMAIPVQTYQTQMPTQIPQIQAVQTTHAPTTHIPTTHVPSTSTTAVALEQPKAHSHSSTHRRSRSNRTERPKTPDSDSSIEGLLERYEVVRSGKGIPKSHTHTHYDLSDDSTTHSEGLNFTLRGGRGDSVKSSRSRSSKGKIEMQSSSEGASGGICAKFVAFIGIIFSFIAAIGEAIYEGFSAFCHRLGDRRPSSSRSRRTPSPMSRRAAAREVPWR